MESYLSLSKSLKALLFVFSFFIVAFGQPVWSEWLALASACGGFACFLRVLLSIPSKGTRFWMGLAWFAAVQAVQLSWFLSHPYLYIYGVVVFCMLLMGIQWGILAIFITRDSVKRITSLLALAGLWTLLEWSRLFILSGLPFNPVGLTFSGSLFSLQWASLEVSMGCLFGSF